jgi:hypothetical protein
MTRNDETEICTLMNVIRNIDARAVGSLGQPHAGTLRGARESAEKLAALQINTLGVGHWLPDVLTM